MVMECTVRKIAIFGGKWISFINYTYSEQVNMYDLKSVQYVLSCSLKKGIFCLPSVSVALPEDVTLFTEHGRTI